MTRHSLLEVPAAQEEQLLAAVNRILIAAELDSLLAVPGARRYRRGFDRFAMRFGVTLLIWGRRRAARTVLSGAEHARLRQQTAAVREREQKFRREYWRPSL